MSSRGGQVNSGILFPDPGFRLELKSLCENRVCAHAMKYRIQMELEESPLGVWTPLVYVSKWDANIWLLFTGSRRSETSKIWSLLPKWPKMPLFCLKYGPILIHVSMVSKPQSPFPPLHLNTVLHGDPKTGHTTCFHRGS